MTLTIQHQSEASVEQWQRFWTACEHATFFQSPQWAQIWEEHTQGLLRPEPKLFRFSDGKEAVLPLYFEPKLRGILSRYVSSPEGTYGGWLSAEPLRIEHAVLLTQWMLRAEGKNLAWRLNPYDPLALEAALLCNITGRKDVTHAVRLDGDAEQLFKGFKKGCREDIKKAQKRADIDVSPATTLDEWRAYYRVYQDSLQRWGHGPNDGYSWQLFDTIRRRDSPNIRLWIARYEGRIVSGELSFYSKRHSVSWHAATLKDYLRSGVSKYQTFEIIKDCCERGFQWLDFNPSAGLDGVKELKESFRAQALPAPLVYVDTPLKSLIRKCAATLNVRYAKLRVEPLERPAFDFEAPSSRDLTSPPSSVASRDAHTSDSRRAN